ncbi:hypothetical protein DH2020_048206 [Rehmannia glutinosa]|uniref:BHLH domain-containing protein n=1 Tax=Rehmannia glutinosa TaxID=99300 RepID=A0ABR0U6D4_REHGL
MNMFSSQSDEVVVFVGPSFFEEADKILEDLLLDCTALEGNEQVNDKSCTVKKRPRKANSSTQKKDMNEGIRNESQKSVHREIERQRRQEMSGLYASLRSLLPLEYIKGKRAVTDQLNQAAIYIKHTQNKIKEMKMRRDKLKMKLSSTTTVPGPAIKDPNNSKMMTSDFRNRVRLNFSRDGIEILISTEECFPLSKVLLDLLGRSELNVISCVSTRVDEWSTLYKIQIQVNDPTSIDLSELQGRLVNVIKLA